MIAWIVETLVASTLLMGVVLLARVPVRRLFGARAAYALWLLPALRMILPPLPGHRTLYVPVAMFRPHDATVGLVDVATASRLAPAALPTVTAPSVPVPSVPVPLLDPAPPPAMHLSALAFVLWLAVAGLVFLLALIRYRRFLRVALASAVPLTVECGVEVLASPAVSGPVATGLWRRRILLPADFLQRYSPEERRLALLHEGAHHDRRDILINLVALAIRALHWWNPLGSAAHRAFRADQELACDETVLADRANSRAVYASTLMKSAVPRMPAMACALNPRHQLRQRIRSMTYAPPGRARILLGALVAGSSILAGTVATASSTAVIAPAPPIAPVPPVAAVVPVPAVAPIAPVPPVHAGLSPAERRRVRDQARRAAERASLSARDAEAQARLAEREAARVEAKMPDMQRMVDTSLAATRNRMVAQCAARGTPVARTADFAALAMCGQDVHAMVRASLERARVAIARIPSLTEAQRLQALAGIDAEIARDDR